MTTDLTCTFYNLVAFILVAYSHRQFPLNRTMLKYISVISATLNSEVSQSIYITKTYCSAVEIHQFNYILGYVIIIPVLILEFFHCIKCITKASHSISLHNKT